MEGKTDILVETLEVLINQILYLRQLYPKQIFKKKNYYNTPILISIYPPLNAYIHNVLLVARELLQNGCLDRAEIVLYTNETDVIESYTFQIKKIDTTIKINTESSCNWNAELLFEVEEIIRKTFYKLAARLKSLNPLPCESKFKVFLYTNQSSYSKLCNSSLNQEFPWQQEVIITHTSSKNISKLPLAFIKQIDLQIDATIICNI